MFFLSKGLPGENGQPGRKVNTDAISKTPS